MKVAIVHEWLASYAGSERVVEQFLKCWPNAPLYAIADFLSEKDRKRIGFEEARTTFIQKLPKAATKFRNYLPLMPLAVEQHDMSSYDVIVSSNHAFAKGVITGPEQLHISYVHTPIRYAWDLQHQYLSEAGLTRGLKSWITRAILHYVRLWDQAAANRVDVMVANSKYIGRRIWRTYRRESEVIYPPVDVDSFPLHEKKEDFYLAASRMVPYKRMPLIAEAFSKMPDKQLVMIGDGTELDKVREVAGPNVKVLGYQSFEVLKDHMQRAKAFVFAAEEDFGITPVEAMASGTPVVAFGRGGAVETVIPGRTGVHFAEQTVESLCEGIAHLEDIYPTLSPAQISADVQKYSPQRFRDEMTSLLDRELDQRSPRPRRHSTRVAEESDDAVLVGV